MAHAYETAQPCQVAISAYLTRLRRGRRRVPPARNKRFEPMPKRLHTNRDSAYTVSKNELLRDGNDVAFRSFIHDFLAFSARVEQCRAGFGELIGLSGTAYTIFISVAHLARRRGVGVSRIAAHLHLSGAFVTIEVSKLVAAGLVAKKTDSHDRRRVLLTVTPKGKGMLEALRRIQAPVNDALFQCLTAADFDVMSATMAELVGCGDRAIALLTSTQSKGFSAPSTRPMLERRRSRIESGSTSRISTRAGRKKSRKRDP